MQEDSNTVVTSTPYQYSDPPASDGLELSSDQASVISPICLESRPTFRGPSTPLAPETHRHDSDSSRSDDQQEVDLDKQDPFSDTSTLTDTENHGSVGSVIDVPSSQSSATEDAVTEKDSQPKAIVLYSPPRASAFMLYHDKATGSC